MHTRLACLAAVAAALASCASARSAPDLGPLAPLEDATVGVTDGGPLADAARPDATRPLDASPALDALPPDTTTRDAALDAAPSADAAPSGDASAWLLPPLPAPSAPQPMTCAWLDGDNCWKRVARAAADCAPGATPVGTFDAAGQVCSVLGGARLELGSSLGTITIGTSQYPVTDHRILAPSGAPCVTTWIAGVGLIGFAAGGEAVVLRTPNGANLLEFDVTCPDGSTYANYGAGVCADFSLRYLGGGVPGETLVCDGATRTCAMTVSGTEVGTKSLVRCTQ